MVSVFGVSVIDPMIDPVIDPVIDSRSRGRTDLARPLPGAGGRCVDRAAISAHAPRGNRPVTQRGGT